MNAASMTALLASPLVAFRTGRLRDLLIGPALGLAAGFLDLQAMLWLYAAGCSINVAASVPVWGGILGLWIASGKQQWFSRLVVFSTITMSDLLMRIAWQVIWPRVLLSELDLEGLWDWQWLLEAVVYVPVAVLSVLLASRPRDPLWLRAAEG